MKQSIRAPLCSIFVPGLGQMLNRQLIKGIILNGVLTAIFIGIVLKILFDLSASMGEVMGTDLSFSSDQWPLVIDHIRNRDLSLLYILIGLGTGIWIFSIVDAFIHGRRYQPPED